jgi:hypothetical protein
MRFLLQHLWAAITSQVPPSGKRKTGTEVRNNLEAIPVCGNMVSGFEESDRNFRNSFYEV